MPKDDLIYWDSMLFIYRLDTSSGWYTELRLFTDAAERGELRIVTSAFAMTEVVRIDGVLPEDQERRIVDFFENDYIVIRALDRLVAERTREVIRSLSLKPKDAVHVATALIANVNVMYTCDKEHLLSKNGLIGDPPLRIEEPRWPGQRDLGLQLPP